MWDAVNDTLKDPPGLAFKKKYDFQVRAIINMRTYGVLYYNERKGNLWDGYLCVDDKVKKSLVVELVRPTKCVLLIVGILPTQSHYSVVSILGVRVNCR